MLVTIMHANNETGTVLPIAECAAIAREHGVGFHTDAAQSVGKISTRVDELGIDLLTMAGHKFHAPKGVGALFIRDGLETCARLICVPACDSVGSSRLEAVMGRRRIGQEVMGFARAERRTTLLDELASTVDWGPLEARLGAISPPGRGEPGWPPLALLKALLLGFWHDLSDVKLAEALEDRASFRRFCGFSGTEATPERTAFVRFRRELVRLRLDTPLFAEVVRQLDARGLTVRTGALVDATVIRAASRDDGQAGWKAWGPGAPVKGYKAHVATDEVGGIVRRVSVTAANAHDAGPAVELVGRHPGRIWADSAYDTGAFKERIRRGGGTAMIVRRLHAGSRDAWNAGKRAWNATINPVRCRIEKVFGTTKRSYGLDRARYMGRPRVSLQAHLTFIAYNLRRAVTLLRLQPA